MDMILCDPPYGINYRSNHRVKSPKFDVIVGDTDDVRLSAYADMYRVMKHNSVCIIFASYKNFAVDYAELVKRFDVKNVIVWWKHGGGMGDLRHTLFTDYELAIVCHKGKCPIRGKREGSVWECNKVNPNEMLHPTQKPIGILERLIEKYSDESDVIMDTFMGSGSTGVACANTGRRFIGIEKDQKYFDIASDRIADAFSCAKSE